MQLLKFRVERFRSIEDTGWLPFSVDNITALVGQNESGKSGILDALALGFGLNERANSDDFRIGEDGPAISLAVKFDDQSLANAILALPANWRETVVEFFAATAGETILASIVPLRGEPVRKFDLVETERARLKSLISNHAAVAVTASIIDSLQEEFPYEDFRQAIWKEVPEFLLFREEGCLLPNRMDIANGEVVAGEGSVGASNFLEAAGINLPALLVENDRVLGTALSKASASLTAELQAVWSQLLGQAQAISLECEIKHYAAATPDKVGQPYLVFWVREGDEKLYPSQRSKGTRWFISFFLQLLAEHKTYPGATVFLLDEPAAFLHPSAQKDVIGLIDRLSKEMPVIYSTHSPFLLDHRKIHRVLAVERQRRGPLSKETVTVVRRGFELATASQLTLAPILSLIGVDIGQQEIIKANRNVLLEEISAYYYLEAFRKLVGYSSELHLVAASGVDTVKTLVDLLIAWRIGFTVLVDDDPHGKQVCREIKKKYLMDDQTASAKLQTIAGCSGIEDLFEHLDFSTHVLGAEFDPGVPNSLHVKNAKLSKPMLALQFWDRVRADELTSSMLSVATMDRARSVFMQLERSFA